MVSVIWASRGPWFELAGIRKPFIIVLCICHLGLAEIWVSVGRYMWAICFWFFASVIWAVGDLCFSWPVYVGQLCLFFVSVIWASQGSEFQLVGICGPFVFVLYICHLGLMVIRVAAGLYMWAICIWFFAFVIWASRDLGFSWPVYVGHLHLVLCICHLGHGDLGFSWPVYVGHLYLFYVFVISRGSGFQLAGMCGAFVFVLCISHLGLMELWGSTGLYMGGICICSSWGWVRRHALT